MWLMTTDGFYSVSRWDRQDEYENLLCIRARLPEHLEALRSKVAGLTEIAVSPGGDYRYRVWCVDGVFLDVLAALAAEIEYPNFKSAVLAKQGATAYEKALHSIWTVLSKIQPRGPYGWGGAEYPSARPGEPETSTGRLDLGR